MAGEDKKIAENAEEKNLTLEECFKKIEDIARDLKDGEMDLEESFKAYKDGMDLLKICSEKIDAVEKKVLVMREEGLLDEF